MTDISLSCECGKTQGIARGISPDSGTRVVCYCDDCQAFARHLGREDSVLDPWGGTDIFQTAPAHIAITEGREYIRCLKLTPKGPYRWYAGCCNTPIANTGSASLPFAGMITAFMEIPADEERILGPVGWYLQGKYATKPLPPGRKIVGFPLSLLVQLFWNILVWKLKGLGKPTPFFDEDGTPVTEPELVQGRKEG
ncbi:DUF6151 family protein [Emcibacter sp.]|uniref:DUF6151 family protein n=1 Tax=Emcibacter sp. TaxID=1979954 RepID=UPI002AA8D134|nr:DUF6151 family protein [Emcibacter sp.]